MLLALHPGTQGLLVSQGDALIEGRPIDMTDSFGAGSSSWRDWVVLSETYPQLARDWVRVVVTAGDVPDDLYAFARVLASDRRAVAGVPQKQRNEVAPSPVVLASLRWPKWLIEKMWLPGAVHSHKAVDLARNDRVWAPLSVSAAKSAVGAAKAMPAMRVMAVAAPAVAVALKRPRRQAVKPASKPAVKVRRAAGRGGGAGGRRGRGGRDDDYDNDDDGW